LGHGPKGVFGDERFGVECRFSKRFEVLSSARVSQGNTHVAEESAALDALDGRILEERAESSVVECEKISQTPFVREGACGKAYFRGCLGETVPGTDGGAIITSVNTVAQQGA
jgi:hypothetical protein